MLQFEDSLAQSENGNRGAQHPFKPELQNAHSPHRGILEANRVGAALVLGARHQAWFEFVPLVAFEQACKLPVRGNDY